MICVNNYARNQVKATGDGQFPFAAILGCIDFRASNELIFDQGVDNNFSVRIAGNFVNDDMLGSLEVAIPLGDARPISTPPDECLLHASVSVS